MAQGLCNDTDQRQTPTHESSQESPAPPLQLIGRWEGYLVESKNRFDDAIQDDLEERWRDFSKEYPLKTC
jgi:hypothetical protein